ncbi:MAG: QueT transporter family protein [Clostridiales bacterium]|nr:QueT transporter family protein [Clostridiales bacterium]
MNRFSTAKICRAGIIASVYFVLTYFLQAISFGPLQARVAEVLTVLPLFFAESVPALFIGCFLANFFSGFLVFDLTLGSLATLISAILTRFIAKIIKNKHLKFFLGAFPPVIINALLIPLVIYLGGGLTTTYFIQSLLIFGSQAIVIYPLGGILYYALDSLKGKTPNSPLWK